MEIFDGHRALLRPLVAPAIALGNFDGVHCGHRRLLEETVRAAERTGGDALVLTFDPHPAQVLAARFAPPLLTGRERKLELIAETGINACIVEPFTRDLAALSPQDFLQTILCDIVGARHIVVGYDFTYGHKRAGTTHTLRAFGQARDIAVDIIDPVTIDGIVASSTKVREFVSAGKLEGARLLLGRNFDVDGTVVRGAGRGRTIGINTANILPKKRLLLPKSGVYAAMVTLLDSSERSRLGGVANLGTNPTFTESGEMSLEVHLLNFSGDLYGQQLRVEFVRRLRGEQRFPTADALVGQIHADIDQARQYVATETDSPNPKKPAPAGRAHNPEKATRKPTPE